MTAPKLPCSFSGKVTCGGTHTWNGVGLGLSLRGWGFPWGAQCQAASASHWNGRTEAATKHHGKQKQLVPSRMADPYGCVHRQPRPVPLFLLRSAPC